MLSASLSTFRDRRKAARLLGLPMQTTCRHGVKFCLRTPSGPRERDHALVIAQAGLPRRLGVSRAEPDRRAAANRRALHDDEPGAFQCLHELLGDDASHHLASVIHPLAPAVAQREGDSLGDIVGLRGRELLGVGHAGRLAAGRERSKNTPDRAVSGQAASL